MKTTCGKQNLTTAVAAALVALLITAPAAFAGDGKRFVRIRTATETQVVKRDSGANQTPPPLVDETPIQPEQMNNTPASQDNNDANKKPPLKRTPIRRR